MNKVQMAFFKGSLKTNLIYWKEIGTGEYILERI